MALFNIALQVPQELVNALNRLADSNFTLACTLQQEMAKIMAKLEDIDTILTRLEDATTKNTDATESVKTYVAGLKDQLTKMAKDLADAVAGNNSAKIAEQVSRLTALADRIDADAAAEGAISGTPDEGGGTPPDDDGDPA